MIGNKVTLNMRRFTVNMLVILLTASVAASLEPRHKGLSGLFSRVKRAAPKHCYAIGEEYPQDDAIFPADGKHKNITCTPGCTPVTRQVAYVRIVVEKVVVGCRSTKGIDVDKTETDYTPEYDVIDPNRRPKYFSNEVCKQNTREIAENITVVFVDEATGTLTAKKQRVVIDCV